MSGEDGAVQQQAEDLGAFSPRRKRINELVPGRVYQRGQIFTWSRAEKVALISQLRIRVVVNLWPKLDPDLADAKLGWYLFLPCDRAVETLTPRVFQAAEAVARYLDTDRDAAALILCEAGKTRSVFFGALVLHHLLGIALPEAHARVVAAVPSHSLKGFMVNYLRGTGRQPLV